MGGYLRVVFFVVVVVAEAAVAVGVVEFAGSAAVGLGAVFAGAAGAVGEGLSGSADLARGGDLFFFGGEDDALDAVFVAGVAGGAGERSGVEVAQAGAEDGVQGGGLALLEAALEQAHEDEVEVHLDGSAVFGEEEGDGDAVRAFGAGGELALAQVVVAEAGVVDGRGLAVASGGEDVAA